MILSQTFPGKFYLNFCSLKKNPAFYYFGELLLCLRDTMDSGSNKLYTTFPNILLLVSADLADLSHIQKNHVYEKISYFWIENVL